MVTQRIESMETSAKKGFFSRMMDRLNGYNHEQAQTRQTILTKVNEVMNNRRSKTLQRTSGMLRASSSLSLHQSGAQAKYQNLLLDYDGVEEIQEPEVDFEDLVDIRIDPKQDSNYLVVNADHMKKISIPLIKVGIVL